MAYLQGGGRDYSGYGDLMDVGTTTPGQLRQDMKPVVKAPPVELGTPAPAKQEFMAPPTRSFNDDQQYLLETAKGMYGKGQAISPDMRDYYGGKFNDVGLDFNKHYPSAPPAPAPAPAPAVAARPTPVQLGNEGMVTAPAARPTSGGFYDRQERSMSGGGLRNQ